MAQQAIWLDELNPFIKQNADGKINNSALMPRVAFLKVH